MKRNEIQNQMIEEVSTLLARKKIIKLEDVQVLKNSFKDREDITFEDYLLEQALVSKDELLITLSEYYGVPAVDVIGEFFSHRLLRLFPKDVLLVHFMLPYRREEDTLTVVVAEPNDPHLRVVLGEYISHDINFMVGIAQDIHDTIEEFYDEAITYQPYDIANQLMERSAQEVHPSDELYVEDNPNEHIPLIYEETIDDYESD